MAAYFTGGGAGSDVHASGADGLQTLYLMNPNYVGYTDAAAPAAANMMLLNSAVSSLAPASFGHHQPAPAAQHFVSNPLQPPHSGYNLWGPATTTTCAAADLSSRQEGAPGGTSAVSAVLSLSSREAPPVTVAAVPGTEGRYVGASPTTPSQQEQVLMSSRYLKAAQELLDEAVSVSKGVEEAKRATAVKKKDSEGGSGGGAEGGGAGSKSGGAAEMSTAERQEIQMKKSKLVNMLDEVEQRYRQHHHQMQAVASSFEAVAGPGSARTYTALALHTISRQFRCLRDAIAVQVRSASLALGEDVDTKGDRTVGSRLQFIDHQLRQQRALQQLGMAKGGGAWRPQRGLPERSVSVLRAWLFEHFLHPYPKDSDKVMLAKQTGLTRSQVSNWFINARVRLWKPMVEEMYLEETKAGKGDRPGAAAGGGDDEDDNSGDGAGRMSSNTADSARHDNGVLSSTGMRMTAGVDHVHASARGQPVGPRHGDQHSQVNFYGGGGGDGNDGASFQHRFKKPRTTATATDEAAAFHHVSSDVATLQAQAQAAAAARRDEVSHREVLMKFMEAGGSGESGHHHDDDGGGAVVGGYSLYEQFGSEEHFAFAGSGDGGGVSLTLGLPHGGAAGEQTDSVVMGGSNASDGAVAAGYDMNMQSTKSLAAQLMRDFVA